MATGGPSSSVAPAIPVEQKWGFKDNKIPLLQLDKNDPGSQYEAIKIWRGDSLEAIYAAHRRNLGGNHNDQTRPGRGSTLHVQEARHTDQLIKVSKGQRSRQNRSIGHCRSEYYPLLCPGVLGTHPSGCRRRRQNQ